MARHGLTPKKLKYVTEVDGLNFAKLQKQIKYSGIIMLAMVGERNESLMTDTAWPPGSDTEYFACVTTGLLFDKQSGRCLQSTSVYLRIDSVIPCAKSIKQYQAWLRSRLGGKDWGRTGYPAAEGA